jgi:hypothetical protein
MENQGAGVAEVGRRKGLKISCDQLEQLGFSGNSGPLDPSEIPVNPAGLETSPQVVPPAKLSRDGVLNRLDQLAACRRPGDPVPDFLIDKSNDYLDPVSRLAARAAELIRQEDEATKAVTDALPMLRKMGMENTAEVERRLHEALLTAGRSALGMPGTADTFNAWLAEAGLALVLVPARRG